MATSVSVFGNLVKKFNLKDNVDLLFLVSVRIPIERVSLCIPSPKVYQPSQKYFQSFCLANVSSTKSQPCRNYISIFPAPIFSKVQCH